MLSNDQITIVSLMVCEKIDILMNELEVRLNKNYHRYYGSCPIHGGDNANAFSLYHKGHSVPGYWQCRSHNCHKNFRATVLGFTRGVLSNQKYSWPHSNKTVSFKETLDFIGERVIGKPLHTIKVDEDFISKYKFISDVNALTRIKKNHKIIDRNKALQLLKIPAEYYLKRNYSAEVLKRYDVGLCTNLGKEMFNRVVFPIYDENHKFIVGCVGRSLYEKCPKCNLHHMMNSSCPTEPYEIIKCAKWCSSKDFNLKSYLFNYWFAKSHIANSNTVILVEGPGDVLRLEEAGIYNSVALFGTSLSDEQQIILESSGAMSMILLLDSDKAGQAGIDEIKHKCERSYNIYQPSLSTKDVGEMTIEQIKNEIGPIIKETEQNLL